jgi:hypothetical protein
MFILIVFQMFLFNTFILYLRQNIKNEHSFVEKPYYSTTYICEATTPSISRVRTLNYIVLQKGEVHCTVINLSVMCLSLVVLSVSQANNSLQHDISKRLSLQIKYCRNSDQRLSRACIVHLVIKKTNWSYVKTLSCVILELRST